MSKIEKYYNEEGEVGVLISYGYGAGWSTWCTEHASFLLTDKTLVQMCLDNKREGDVLEYLQGVFPDKYICIGGWADCEVEYFPEGTPIIVDEYDGSESVEFIDDRIIVV